MPTARSHPGASIYAIRRGLEGTALRLGAVRLTDSDLDRMTEQLHQVNRIVRAPELEVDSYLRVEWELHELCYRAAGHARLLMEIQAHRRQVQRYFLLLLLDKFNLVDDAKHQSAFYEACSQRNKTEAEAKAQLLLDWTVERVGLLIENLSDAQAPFPGGD
jgi:DNA-binding GntR family transcriptional regulator